MLRLLVWNPNGRPVYGGRSPLVVLLLLSLLAGQATSSMARKAVTTDEILYIAAGYYHLKTGDFQFNMTNPPLMKMIAASPLLILQPELPPMPKSPKDCSLIEQWQFSRSFMYQNNVDADRMLFVARLPVVALAMLLGYYVFRFGAELHGQWSGVLALFLYSLSPNILAHARLTTHDLGLAAFMFIATYYFWRYVQAPTFGRLVKCGLSAGLALLTKTTAVFLAPIFAGYVLICIARGNGLGIYDRFSRVRGWRIKSGRVRQFSSAVLSACVIAVIVLTTLNVGYGFQGTGSTLDADRPALEQQSPTSLKGAIRRQLSKIPLPVPAPFVNLIRFQSSLTAASGNIYFAGKIHEAGLWYLMIVSFLLKTPIAGLALLGAAMVMLLRRASLIEGEWLLASFVAVILFVFSYLASINVGLRYVLPIYPFVHVIIGSMLRQGVRRSKASVGVVIALAGWYAVSSLQIHPHYLAYFNEFIGGPQQGYQYLVDSNLDWGQDLRGLKTYMDDKKIDRIKLGYFGSADANYYGIDYDYLPSVGLKPKLAGQRWWYELSKEKPASLAPQKGIIAVSATLLASPTWMRDLFGDSYEWLSEHEPVDQVGYSMLIYNIK